jgi:hypothetical protein
MKSVNFFRAAALFIFMTAGIAAAAPAGEVKVADARQLASMSSRYIPVTLKVDLSKLSVGDRQALPKIISAARAIDRIFLKQMWQGNETLYARLQKDKTPLGKARLHCFMINRAPWSELDDYRAFLPDVPARKPPGANFYPQGMTKEDFEKWLAGLPPPGEARAKSFFTVIRRQGGSQNGKFVVVPYSKEYAGDLAQASAGLRQAAALTDNASLKKFLNLRAAAFASNDYYESDLSWMDLDAPLDITIGPYETYNDELFGYKAAFEAYVTLRNDAETAKLSAFSAHLQEIEDNLPLAGQYRNPRLGGGAAIRVVDQIMNAGDAAHGVQSAAFNLPNDDRVLQKKGSKRVMLKNVQEAKFRSVLRPIAQKVLSAADRSDLSFEMFFTHILAHELMHGLGPHRVKVAGRQVSLREALKDLDSPIEEAKADVTGLFALQYMMEHAKQMGLEKVLPADERAQRQLYLTYLASTFRSLRFGLHEAHGKGTALQVNFFLDKGAYVANPDGTFTVDMSKMKSAVSELDNILLTIEAHGDYDAAAKLLEKRAVLPASVLKALSGLKAIPSDIEPLFVTADSICKGAN